MTRHVLDHAQPTQSDARAKAYSEIERTKVPSPATRELQQRDHTRGAERLKHFWRKARED